MSRVYFKKDASWASAIDLRFIFKFETNFEMECDVDLNRLGEKTAEEYN